MTRAEVVSWQERWALVNAVTRRQVRATPLEEKFRQTATLMALGHSLGLVRPSATDLTETQKRWMRLKARAGGSSPLV